MRLDEVKEFGYDKPHSIEVSWAKCPFKHLLEVTKIEAQVSGLGIEGRYRRHKYKICPSGFELSKIGFQGLGIILKIFAGVELRWIYEYGNHREVHGGGTFCDQIQMTLVKRTHCRNEAQLFAFLKNG